MRESALRKVVILGGGTAGWTAAAVLAHALRHPFCEVHVVDAPARRTIAFGEASLPSTLRLNRMLGLDEDLLMRRTEATFRLGTKFVNWNQAGHSYFHAFGPHGADIGALQFPHYWRRFRHEAGEAAGSLADYSLPTVAALARKFARPEANPHEPSFSLAYAFHLDARGYALALQEYAEARGVRRLVGVPALLELDERGFATAVQLDDGRRLDGDFFIDCSDCRSPPSEQMLGTSHEDWTRWLPCDRTVAVTCGRIEDPVPYSRATAQRAGWQWRVPLQHRTGNGHVYCSAFIDDEEALQTLFANLDGEILGEPVKLRFTAGRRRHFWHRNVVALGPAAGHLESLEWTDLHLVQSGMTRLLQLFPDRECRQADIDQYNKATAAEHERIRDFLILHYRASRRAEPFWVQAREAALPDTLAEKLEFYRSHGRIADWNDEPFGGDSWTAALEGLGIRPEAYHPLADALPAAELRASLAGLREAIIRSAAALPLHGDFIREHCAAEAAAAPAPRGRIASTAHL